MPIRNWPALTRYLREARLVLSFEQIEGFSVIPFQNSARDHPSFWVRLELCPVFHACLIEPSPTWIILGPGAK
jgi:hypothetical protein